MANPKENEFLPLFKEYFEYRKDGALIWKKRASQRCKIGNAAGTLGTEGYIRIVFRYTSFAAHRIIWALLKGQFPKNELDHINRIRHDNRIENLREATHTQNMINRPKFKTSNKYRGVVKYKNKWKVTITVNKKPVYLGLFKTEIEAARVFEEVYLQLHGDFVEKNEYDNK